MSIAGRRASVGTRQGRERGAERLRGMSCARMGQAPKFGLISAKVKVSLGLVDARCSTAELGVCRIARKCEGHIPMTVSVLMVVLAVALSAALTMLARGLGRRLGILDRPDGVRKLHRHAVPRTGGLAIYVAFFGSIGVGALIGQWRSPDFAKIFSLFLGASGITLIGLWDDVAGARPRWRLLLSALVGLAMWAAGWRIDAVVNPFGRPVELGYWSAAVTVFWLLACINAMNFIDGLDGLAGGITVFVGAALVVSGLVMGNDEASMLALVLCGVAVGFLFFNVSPASIFLGDSGSCLLGFLIACIAMRTSATRAGEMSLAIPAVAMALPAFDTLLALVRRWSRRRPLLSGSDRQHVHHRLLDAGLSQRRAALVLYAVTFALACCAVLMAALERVQGPAVLSLCVAGVVAGWCVGKEELVRAGNRLVGRGEG